MPRSLLPGSACRAAALALAGLLAGTAVTGAQSVRQVSLNTATGSIDRAWLPAGERFDFLIRAASELREFRGQYQAGSDAPVPLESWIRKDPAKSKDATLRITRLDPGTTYQFTFTFVRRPTGNEGRLIEARVQDILRDAFRANPTAPADSVATLVAPRLAAALDTVVPGAVAVPASALAGRPEPALSALAIRGIDVLQADYRRQLDVVVRLRDEYRTARTRLRDAPILARAIEAVSAALAKRGGYAELEAPLAACRAVAATDPPLETGPLQDEGSQLALLGALKTYDGNAGSCLGLLRDVRLPRYQDLGVGGTAAVSDLFPPVASRLEALRGETERLVSLGRRRDGALGQTGTDIRRTLDTGVTLTTTLTSSFATAPVFHLSGVSVGAGLIGAHVPCSATGSCLRIVPAATVSLRIAEPLSAELGLTLANTETEGRTRNLFWFSSGLAGLSLRLGDRPQRIGAGAIVLRRDEPGKNGGFTVGWYVGLTVFDLRI